jgi:hypothetical protein
MKRKFSIRVFVGSALVMAVVATGAQAAPVTLGPELEEPYVTTGAEAGTYLVANTIYAGAGSERFISPVDGVVLHWSVYKAKGTFRLAVMKPGAPEYTLERLSDKALPASEAGVETFATQLPIATGDTIGLEVEPGGTVGIEHGLGGESLGWKPAPAIGPAGPATVLKNDTYGFDAEVLPAPSITGLATTSGPAAGGTAVTISGTDFSHVSGVAFGGIAASTYAVGSEGQILAVAPPGSGEVAVTVTTVAGTATSAQKFTYVAPPAADQPVTPSSPSTPSNPSAPVTPIAAPAPTNSAPPDCKVPALRGKKLKSAKAALLKAHCKPGKVTKAKGATAKTGKVVGQGKRAGSTLAAGTKVTVRLG